MHPQDSAKHSSSASSSSTNKPRQFLFRKQQGQGPHTTARPDGEASEFKGNLVKNWNRYVTEYDRKNSQMNAKLSDEHPLLWRNAAKTPCFMQPFDPVEQRAFSTGHFQAHYNRSEHKKPVSGASSGAQQQSSPGQSERHADKKKSFPASSWRDKEQERRHHELDGGGDEILWATEEKGVGMFDAEGKFKFISDSIMHGESGGIKAPLDKSALFGKPSPVIPQEPPKPVEWFYKDPKGITQGPFSSAQMYDWYSRGFFPESLPLTRGEDAAFESLAIWKVRCGGLCPFEPVAAPGFTSPKPPDLSMFAPTRPAFQFGTIPPPEDSIVLVPPRMSPVAPIKLSFPYAGQKPDPSIASTSAPSRSYPWALPDKPKEGLSSYGGESIEQRVGKFPFDQNQTKEPSSSKTLEQSLEGPEAEGNEEELEEQRRFLEGLMLKTKGVPQLHDVMADQAQVLKTKYSSNIPAPTLRPAPLANPVISPGNSSPSPVRTAKPLEPPATWKAVSGPTDSFSEIQKQQHIEREARKKKEHEETLNRQSGPKSFADLLAGEAAGLRPAPSASKPTISPIAKPPSYTMSSSSTKSASTRTTLQAHSPRQSSWEDPLKDWMVSRLKPVERHVDAIFLHSLLAECRTAEESACLLRDNLATLNLPEFDFRQFGKEYLRKRFGRDLNPAVIEIVCPRPVDDRDERPEGEFSTVVRRKK